MVPPASSTARAISSTSAGATRRKPKWRMPVSFPPAEASPFQRGCPPSGDGPALLVLDYDRGSRVDWRHGKTAFAEQAHVLLHAPSGLVEAVLHGAPDSREALQLGRVETEVVR